MQWLPPQQPTEQEASCCLSSQNLSCLPRQSIGACMQYCMLCNPEEVRQGQKVIFLSSREQYTSLAPCTIAILGRYKRRNGKSEIGNKEMGNEEIWK